MKGFRYFKVEEAVVDGGDRKTGEDRISGGRWQVVAGDVGRGGRRKSEGRGC